MRKMQRWFQTKQTMHKSKLQNQLEMISFQTMKAKMKPTRKMAIKLPSLVTRSRFKNMATGHHLDLKMAKLVMTRMFSPKVEGLNTPGITSLSTVYKGLSGYFS